MILIPFGICTLLVIKSDQSAFGPVSDTVVPILHQLSGVKNLITLYGLAPGASQQQLAHMVNTTASKMLQYLEDSADESCKPAWAVQAQMIRITVCEQVSCAGLRRQHVSLTSVSFTMSHAQNNWHSSTNKHDLFPLLMMDTFTSGCFALASFKEPMRKSVTYASYCLHLVHTMNTAGPISSSRVSCKHGSRHLCRCEQCGGAQKCPGLCTHTGTYTDLVTTATITVIVPRCCFTDVPILAGRAYWARGGEYKLDSNPFLSDDYHS